MHAPRKRMEELLTAPDPDNYHHPRYAQHPESTPYYVKAMAGWLLRDAADTLSWPNASVLLLQDTIRWILAKNEYVFGFEACCHYWRLDPSAVRHRLLAAWSHDRLLALAQQKRQPTGPRERITRCPPSRTPSPNCDRPNPAPASS